MPPQGAMTRYMHEEELIQIIHEGRRHLGVLKDSCSPSVQLGHQAIINQLLPILFIELSSHQPFVYT